jgi:heat shock protein HslJ
MRHGVLCTGLGAAAAMLSACTSPPRDVAPVAAAALAAPTASAAPAAAPPIVGTTWHWFRTLDPERSWEATDPTRYTLTLAADGRALVRADCNRGSGGYTLQDGRLELGPIATTRMACPDVGGLDGRFLQQLAGIRLVVVDAGLLRADLYADSGTMFFVAEADAQFGSYRCAGGLAAWAVYTQDRARVVAGPDTFDLPLAVSASGARYARGDVVWWVKGDGAFMEQGGARTLDDCVRSAPGD